MLMNVYIIDDTIIFSPSECTLTSAFDSNLSQSLSEPASRCFEKLLISGELVSQNDLYELGWAGRPITPSPNTLYQTISSIRRSFKALKPSGVNPVLTETRKGFRINPELHIKYETLNANGLTEESSIELKQPNGKIDFLYIYKRKKFKLLLGTTLMVLILILYIFFNLLQSKSNPFENYQKINIPSFPDCKIYFSDVKEPINERDLKSAEFNCSTHPYNYITRLNYHLNVSILSCTREINSKKNHCHIVYLRGMLND